MNTRACPLCATVSDLAICPNCAKQKLSVPTLSLFQLRHRKRRYESGSGLLAKAINALVIASDGRMR